MTKENFNKPAPLAKNTLKEMTTFVPGDRVADRFEVIRPLRDGCQGAIYLVRHVDFPERKIAMKVLLLSQEEDFEVTAKRFRNEVMAAYSVTHPNVVRVYDYVRDGQIIAFTMEYVIGGDLADLLAYDEPLKIHQILHILEQVCEGVNAIHEAGIIHRDLKPENILINKEGQVKISDFGTARMGTTLGRKGGITGTVAYLSPEYLKEGHLDFRSDLYSLGIVAFEMIAGDTPFRGGSLIETLTMRLNEKAPSVRDFNGECPASLSAIVARLLALDPNDRFSSATEVLRELQKVRVRRATQHQHQNLTSTQILNSDELENSLEIPDTEKIRESSIFALPSNNDLFFDDGEHNSQVAPKRARANTINQTISEYVSMPNTIAHWFMLIIVIIVGFAAGQFAPLLFSGDITSSLKEMMSNDSAKSVVIERLEVAPPNPPKIEKASVSKDASKPEDPMGITRSATLPVDSSGTNR